MEGSSCVAQQAPGYVLGVTGIEPKIETRWICSKLWCRWYSPEETQILVNTHV